MQCYKRRVSRLRLKLTRVFVDLTDSVRLSRQQTYHHTIREP